MAAIPVDIARYTSDGVLITVKNEAIKERDPNAQDTGDREISMFFDVAEHGDILADELFAYVGAEGRPHEGIETGDTLGLGSTVPVFPRSPRARIVDAEREIDTVAVVRAYSFDMASDTYALELVGLLPGRPPEGTPLFDSTQITLDSYIWTWDSDFDPFG